MNKNKISFKSILLSVIYLVSLVFPGYGQDNGIFIVQVTDPQFGFFSNNEEFSRESLLFEKAVTEINRIKPAFVVITGDLIHDKGSQVQWNEFIRIKKLIDTDIPVWVLPGNHDVGQNPVATDIEKLKGYFGDDKFSFRYNEFAFIGLNSAVIKAGENEFEKAQFEWLENELVTVKDARQIIVFSHHPFFIGSPYEPETYSNINPATRKKYLELFSLHNVKAIFAGHLHNNGYGRFKTIEMVTTSAIGRPLADTPSGLRIIKLSGDKLSHQYYDINNVPETIVLGQ